MIGIIGNGKHSKRIQKLLENKHKLFIYKPDTPNYYDKKQFETLKKCKIIFIISKNSSHFNYIKILKKQKFIFCEKPPVINNSDLNKLKKFNLNQIYFNFNFRFFLISKLIKKYEKKLGKLIYGNIILSHGLVKKRGFFRSWRSKKSENKHGVFENVTIHWIDFVNYLFKIKNLEKNHFLDSYKKKYFDSAITTIKTNSSGIVNIFNSYNTPYIKDLKFVFDNGIITQRDNIIEIRGPAKNFDKNSNFIKPKLIKKIKINDNKDYENSLRQSVNFFLDHALNSKKKFPKNLNKMALFANQMLLNSK